MTSPVHFLKVNSDDTFMPFDQWDNKGNRPNGAWKTNTHPFIADLCPVSTPPSVHTSDFPLVCEHIINAKCGPASATAHSLTKQFSNKKHIIVIN